MHHNLIGQTLFVHEITSLLCVKVCKLIRNNQQQKDFNLHAYNIHNTLRVFPNFLLEQRAIDDQFSAMKCISHFYWTVNKQNCEIWADENPLHINILNDWLCGWKTSSNLTFSKTRMGTLLPSILHVSPNLMEWFLFWTKRRTLPLYAGEYRHVVSDLGKSLNFTSRKWEFTCRSCYLTRMSLFL